MQHLLVGAHRATCVSSLHRIYRYTHRLRRMHGGRFELVHLACASAVAEHRHGSGGRCFNIFDRQIVRAPGGPRRAFDLLELNGTDLRREPIEA
jgi:hypothetical protein